MLLLQTDALGGPLGALALELRLRRLPLRLAALLELSRLLLALRRQLLCSIFIRSYSIIDYYIIVLV